MKNHCNRDFRIEFADLKNHCDRDSRIEYFRVWKIIVIVIFASNILLDLNQFALKIWKSSSWVTQKKHDLMFSLSAAFNIENLISYNSQSRIWWLNSWLNDKKIEFEFQLFSILSAFYTGIDELLEKKMIKRERRRSRDRIRCQISKIFSIFYFYFIITFTFTILNAQLDRTAVFEDVFDTIQLFTRRKF